MIGLDIPSASAALPLAPFFPPFRILAQLSEDGEGPMVGRLNWGRRTCVLEYRAAQDGLEAVFAFDDSDLMDEWLSAEGLHVARGQP